MDVFICSRWAKVKQMADFSSEDNFERRRQEAVPINGGLSEDEDLLMEQILENINTTPIGLVLKKIASLPEVRKEKILNVRRQLTEGEYDLERRLDIALDKVLEDLIA